jgi:hypothetical protein
MIHPTTLYMMATSHNDELESEARAARLARQTGRTQAEQRGTLNLKSAKVAALASLLLAVIVIMLA